MVHRAPGRRRFQGPCFSPIGHRSYASENATSSSLLIAAPQGAGRSDGVPSQSTSAGVLRREWPAVPGRRHPRTQIHGICWWGIRRTTNGTILSPRIKRHWTGSVTRMPAKSLHAPYHSCEHCDGTCTRRFGEHWAGIRSRTCHPGATVEPSDRRRLKPSIPPTTFQCASTTYRSASIEQSASNL